MPDPDDIEDADLDNETVAANRAIEQGGGFGARELKAQRDPDRDNYSDVEADVEQAAADEAEGDVEKP